jgi:hypothetical protein
VTILTEKGVLAPASSTRGFKQHELWLQYRGSAADMLYADIFENWLEAER